MLTLTQEGQDILEALYFQCKNCNTYLSPRTSGFLTYTDRLGRSNCKLAPEKILQIIFHWASRSSVVDCMELLDLTKPSIIDWFNFCRDVCTTSNIIAHTRKLGNGQARGTNGELPDVVIQIDECLLRGKRMYNRGRILTGDQNILIEDIAEWMSMNENNENQMDPGPNYGRRITGPWIFGMAECIRSERDKYKTGEVRLFKVEKRDAATLIPLIVSNVEPGSMIWSDQWAAYNQIQSLEAGLSHEKVNHSENFVSITGAYTQNIEREWSKLKLKLLKNMRGTSEDLLQSHLEEYMWRSRVEGGIWEVFMKIIKGASEQYPITT
ncbi:hypothetical protein RF11_12237 [Thelohanellus kitauei]|uniref:ISXO2-like transposase domain-containing protein n=1 Tax=Thelohanellus kitauei TaxID=669202 RepID=A0A0C2MMK5_THEKT|nr:hypothetical protein RF11_12237 [Thelohanellus kitauei]